MVGEASIAMATACFGTSMNGNNGHDETDVLYIAFPGADAVPGSSGADWGALVARAPCGSLDGTRKGACGRCRRSARRVERYHFCAGGGVGGIAAK